jgi:hypothetical protein
VTSNGIEPDLQLIIVTILVGPGMNGHPVTEDIGAFQQLVMQKLSTAASEGIGLNLIFDQGTASTGDGVSGAKFVRFDKARQRVTVSVAVPTDLSARMTTRFIREQTADALHIADAHLGKRLLQGSLDNVRKVLGEAWADLPSEPLSEAERHRQVEYARTSAEEPIRSAAELDAAGREVRKVDIYADGAADYAIRSIETGTTRLNSRQPGPGDVVQQISAATFAEIWQAAIAQEQPRGSITTRATRDIRQR